MTWTRTVAMVNVIYPWGLSQQDLLMYWMQALVLITEEMAEPFTGL